MALPDGFHDLPVDDQIDALHDEAEYLVELAKVTRDPEVARGHRKTANRLVAEAARIRARSER